MFLKVVKLKSCRLVVILINFDEPRAYEIVMCYFDYYKCGLKSVMDEICCVHIQHSYVFIVRPDHINPNVETVEFINQVKFSI